MRTKIILLSDGTGNSDAALWRTNVWRLLNYIDRTTGDQIVLYQSGIGTASSLFSRLFGRAFGVGLPNNVLILYKFLCQNYKYANAEIFGFGFSRGAYTIRAVMELVVSQGLVSPEISDAKMNRKVEAAYRAYRAENFHSILGLERLFRLIRDMFVRALHGPYRKELNVVPPQIRFIGLWNTVGAYGFPIEGMARGISQLIWPFELSNGNGSPRIVRVCHALSLDDDRTTFHPILWDERDEGPAKLGADGYRFTKDERISQVWFPGAHSNLGGGLPDDSLAQISLYWMINEAKMFGLRFKGSPDAISQTKSAQDYEGRIYNPREGNGSLYRYGPRNLIDLYRVYAGDKPENELTIIPKIHESVFKRVRGRQRYAPINLPEKYEVVTDDGRILSIGENPYEAPEKAVARSVAQDRVWNKVWLRPLFYYATIIIVLYLLCYPLFYDVSSSENSFILLPPIANIFRFIGALVPPVSLWTDAYAQDPGWLLLVIFAIYFLRRAGIRLEGKIRDDMRAIWYAGESQPHKRSLINDWIYQFRKSSFQRWMYRLRQRTWPAVFAFSCSVLFFYIVLSLTNSVIFDIRDANGAFCRHNNDFQGRLAALMVGENRVVPFETSAFCSPTNVLLEAGGRYRITITQLSPWRKGDIKTSMSGFDVSGLPWQQRLQMFCLLPLRRAFIRPYFRLIARIGSIGQDQEFIDSDPNRIGGEVLVEIITPKRAGQLYLYVNDAVLAAPGFEELFYLNNSGSASVTIERLI